MFLKAAFCEVCKVLWFYKGSEVIGPAKGLLVSDEKHGLSELELERLQWIIDYDDKPHATKFWNEYIKEKSPELYKEYLTLCRWTAGGTTKIINKT